MSRTRRLGRLRAVASIMAAGTVAAGLLTVTSTWPAAPGTSFTLLADPPVSAVSPSELAGGSPLRVSDLSRSVELMAEAAAAGDHQASRRSLATARLQWDRVRRDAQVDASAASAGLVSQGDAILLAVERAVERRRGAAMIVQTAALQRWTRGLGAPHAGPPTEGGRTPR